jgi:hypothetical protein
MGISDAHVELVSLLGAIVLKGAIADTETTLDLSHVPAGVYCLHIAGGSVTRILRVVR